MMRKIVRRPGKDTSLPCNDNEGQETGVLQRWPRVVKGERLGDG